MTIIDSTQLLPDPSLEDEFNPDIKGNVAYEVTPDTIQLVPVMNAFPLPHIDFFYVKGDNLEAPEFRDAWASKDSARVTDGLKSLVWHVNDLYDAGMILTANAPDYGHVTMFVRSRTRWKFTNADTYVDACQLLLQTHDDGSITLAASANVHAWSNHNVTGYEHVGEPHCSVGVDCDAYAKPASEAPPLCGDPLNDAISNITIWVGLDTTGNINPLASTVKWSEGWNVYNPPGTRIEKTIQLKKADSPSEPISYPFREGPLVGAHSILHDNVEHYAQKLTAAGTRLTTVKFVDDSGWISRIQEVSPETVTIGRYVWSGEGCHQIGTLNQDQIKAHAIDSVEFILNKLDAQPSLRETVKLWELWNEPDPNDPDPIVGHRALADCMFYAMEEAERHDLHLLLPSFNAGCPEYDEMKAMAETGVFDHMAKGGHAISLHEGVLSSHDYTAGMGDLIPGAPAVPDGAGSLNFRFVYLYDLIQQYGDVPPLYVTEWYCGDEQSAPEGLVPEALAWYEDLASRFYYFISVMPFTLGTAPGMWDHTDYDPFYPAITDHALTLKDRPNALPPTTPTLPSYPATIVLTPRQWGRRAKEAAGLGIARSGYTNAESAQDPGNLALSDEVTSVTILALNPEEIGTGLTKSWYDTHYPAASSKINFVPIQVKSHSEIALFLQPDLPPGTSIALNQRDHPNIDLGEEAGGETIYEAGCLLDVLGIMLRVATSKDIDAPFLNDLLVFADKETNTFSHDDLLDWHGAISIFPSVFDNSRKINRAFTASELQALLDDGWLVGLARSDFGHFVYLDRVAAGGLSVIDPWYGEHRTWSISQVGGIRAAHLTKVPEPPSHTELLAGLHDAPGGTWMEENNVKGLCLALAQVQDLPCTVDFSHLASANVDVILRVNWGYADGTGTVPPEHFKDAHIAAVIETLDTMIGCDKVVYANELNNPSEWPGGYPDPTFIPSPLYYASIYNAIAEETPVKLAPFAVDPYNVVAGQFGQPYDPKVWAQTVYENIIGLDFICLHAKTQTNDPAQCWSYDTFADPLAGRYIHLRTVEDQLSWIPEEYESLPVVITELNPQYRADGTLGWSVSPNPDWITEAFAYLRTQPISGAILYRYEKAGDQAAFGLRGRTEMLDALKTEAAKAEGTTFPITF